MKGDACHKFSWISFWTKVGSKFSFTARIPKKSPLKFCLKSILRYLTLSYAWAIHTFCRRYHLIFTLKDAPVPNYQGQSLVHFTTGSSEVGKFRLLFWFISVFSLSTSSLDICKGKYRTFSFWICHQFFLLLRTSATNRNLRPLWSNFQRNQTLVQMQHFCKNGVVCQYNLAETGFDRQKDGDLRQKRCFVWGNFYWIY